MTAVGSATPDRSPTLAIGLSGASGRMGRAIREAVAVRSDLELVACRSRGGGESVEELVARSTVIIDFSSPAATAEVAAEAARHGRALVIGTTGLDEPARAAIDAAARRAACVVAANTSVGVTLLGFLVEQAARLVPGWDVEIVETHHRGKVDAPSGTALALAEAVRAGSARSLALEHGRHGRAGPRRDDVIGMHALRGGDAIGEHVVQLSGRGERLELGHRAFDRQLFAEGALRAASFVAQAPPGSYGMRHVLGIEPVRQDRASSRAV